MSLRLDDQDYTVNTTGKISVKSGWMLDEILKRKFQGNFNRMFNRLNNKMEIFTKTSRGSFKGNLMGSLIET